MLSALLVYFVMVYKSKSSALVRWSMGSVAESVAAKLDIIF